MTKITGSGYRFAREIIEGGIPAVKRQRGWNSSSSLTEERKRLRTKWEITFHC